MYLIEFMLTFRLERNLALRISDAGKGAFTQITEINVSSLDYTPLMFKTVADI